MPVYDFLCILCWDLLNLLNLEISDFSSHLQNFRPVFHGVYFLPHFPRLLTWALGMLVSDLETVAVPADTGIPVGRFPRLTLRPTSGGSMQCPRASSCLTRAVGKPLLVLSFISGIIILRPRVPISFLCFIFLC